MKKIGLIIVVSLILCAFGIQSAAAQESPYGYIPLLEKDYDTSIPREIQSRENYMVLLQDLVNAKEKGSILDFQPDFFGGFVRVTSPSEALRSGSDKFVVKDNLWEAIVRPPIGDATRNLKTASFMAYMHNDESCFNINDAGDSVRIKGTLTTSTGIITGLSDGTTDSSGYLWDCFDGPYPTVVPGIKVTFKTYNSSGTLLNTYSVTAPRYWVKSINHTTGTVNGTAPAGKAYEVYWDHRLLDAGDNSDEKMLSGTVTSAGTWEETFGTGMKGVDSVYFYLKQSTRFTFNVVYNANLIFCSLGTNVCQFWGTPKKPLAMTITHNGVTYKFTGTTDKLGTYYAYLENSSGDPIMLVPGDKITATGAFSEILPKLTAIPNRATDKVSGLAPKNTYFSVRFIRYDTYEEFRNWTGSTSTGTYVSDFTWTDIPSDVAFMAKVRYFRPTTGNGTQYYILTP